MANTQLTQTGAQVQADLDKVEELATIKTIGSGLSLSNAGELSSSGGGVTFGKVYLHASNTGSTYFKIKYLDGTIDNNWVTVTAESLHYIQTTKPFKLLYATEYDILSPSVKYNGQYGEPIPFQVSNSIVWLNGSGTITGSREGFLVYTLINVDLHIYYTDNGID